MVLIDLSKAFDNLRHSSLLTKLQLLGTRLRELRHSSGSSVSCQTDSSVLELEHHCRISPLTITHGIPQGSILGLMLFTLYMTDLPMVTKFTTETSNPT